MDELLKQAERHRDEWYRIARREGLLLAEARGLLRAFVKGDIPEYMKDSFNDFLNKSDNECKEQCEADRISEQSIDAQDMINEINKEHG